MKIKPDHRKHFIDVYSRCCMNTLDYLNEYGKALLETVDDHDFESELDLEFFEELAKEGFLKKLLQWHEKNKGMIDALSEAKKIIAETEDDED